MEHRSLRLRPTGRRWRGSGRRGVSDVVATILLLALTVTLFASIFAFVTSFPAPPAQNNNQFQASLSFSANLANVTAIHILHLAGPVVAGNALIYLKSATQPSAPEFQNPYTVSSGLGGASVWNLGQVWNLTFPSNQRPTANGNITVYVVASSQLLYSVILPGTSIAPPPTIVSTSIFPTTPGVGASFTVYASIAGTYTTQSVYVNLAGVPNTGALNTPQKMVQNAQGQWTFFVGSGLTTTSGTFYAFVNASSASGSRGQQATGAVVITIANGGTVNGPFSVGVILIPSPPNALSAETVDAVVTYSGVLLTPAALNVTFTSITVPYSASKWTGWAPTGLTISGGTSVTAVSKTTWTVPLSSAPASFLVYANATVAGVGTVSGVLAFTTPSLSLSAASGLVGSAITATGAAFVASTGVTLAIGGVAITPTSCSSGTLSGSTVTTTTSGGFVCVFNVPAGSPAGATVVVASDGTTGQNDTFVFTVTPWTVTPLSPTSGIIGTTVTATGSGFAASSSVTLAFDGISVTPTGGSSCAHTGATITTTAAGGFVCTFAVPGGSTAGAGGLVATDAVWGQTASAPFTVTSWTISPLSVTSGVIGASVTVTGAGFAVSSGVTLAFEGIAITPSSCSVGTAGATITTTAAGAFTCVITIPAGSTGGAAGSLVATDASGGQTTSALFTVAAWTTSLSVTSGVIGTSVTITGTGFAASSGVTLSFEGVFGITPSSCSVGTAGATITTTAAGAFTCVFTIPSGTDAGAGSVVSSDVSGGQTTSSAFTVTAWTISPLSVTSGVIGTSVTVTGSGFAVSSGVTLVFGVIGVTVSSCSAGTAGATITTTAAGAFTCVFTIPAGSVAGAGSLVATDTSGGQTASAPFTVTSWTISPLSVTSGLVYTSTTVTGTGFAVSSGVTLVFGVIPITVSSCSVGTAGATITTTAAGAFTCVLNIPYSSSSGVGTLTATDASGGQTATATFTVTAWSLSVSPGALAHGSTQSLSLTGAGFAASSTVQITYNGAIIIPSSCSSGTITGTNTVVVVAAGGFVCAYTMPTGSAGTFMFQVNDVTSGQVATFAFVRS
jgi:hypothetical protein